jgi:hypothetical protein
MPPILIQWYRRLQFVETRASSFSRTGTNCQQFKDPVIFHRSQAKWKSPPILIQWYRHLQFVETGAFSFSRTGRIANNSRTQESRKMKVTQQLPVRSFPIFTFDSHFASTDPKWTYYAWIPLCKNTSALHTTLHQHLPNLGHSCCLAAVMTKLCCSPDS